MSLKTGFRLFDTANLYSSQQKIGKNIINKDPRDIYICTKLWMNEFGENRVSDTQCWDNKIETSCEKTLSELNISQINLLLIHWPMKKNEKTNVPEEFIIEEIWPQMEQLVDKGLVKSIGVSNFGILDLQRLLNICRIKPVINQILVNPYHTNNDLVDFCQKNDIVVMAHSPFSQTKRIFQENKLISIANKYNVPVSCIILKWFIQNKIIPIPGTSSVKHLEEYKNIESLYLEEDDINSINSLNKDMYLYNQIHKSYNVSHYMKYNFKKYKILIPDENCNFSEVFTTDIDYINKCKESLINGQGFLICENVLDKEEIQLLKKQEPKKIRSERYDNSFKYKCLLNKHPIFSKCVDNHLIASIIEPLLGWDCRLDNISYTISKPNGTVFGPHQDSPFEQNIGAPLPPSEYPIVIQTIWCIDDFTEDNGAFFAIPGSHKIRQRVTMPNGGNLERGKIPDNAKKIIAPAGSVIIALGHVWHGADKNVTKNKRLGMLVEYVCSFVDSKMKFDKKSFDVDVLKTFSPRLVRILKDWTISKCWKNNYNIDKYLEL